MGDSFSAGLLDGLSQNSEAIGENLDGFQKEVDALGTIAFEVYAEANGFTFEAVSEKAGSEKTGVSDQKLFKSLPTDSDVAIDVSGFGTVVNDFINKNAGDIPAEQKQLVDSVKALTTQLGDEGVVVAKYKSEDDYTVGFVGTVKDAGAATRATNDLLTSIGDGFFAVEKFDVGGGTGWVVGSLDGGDPLFAAAVVNDRFVVGNTEDYVKALAAGNGKLGDDAAVKKATANDGGTAAAGFVNVANLVDDTDPDSAWAKSVGSLGYKVWNDGEHVNATVHLALR